MNETNAPAHDPMPDPSLVETSRDALRRFHAAFEPSRPELYRYCRHLTRSPWDAEDLVQDTLARAFVTLAMQLGPAIERPRSWLFRVATNLWLDRARRAREDLGVPDEAGAAAAPDLQGTREAAGTLIARLSPQERVAVVLKDAFDLSLEEIAEALGTTTGAVKAALHRGRGKLVAPEPEAPRVPAHAAVDAFCAAFNARDLAGLTALLLDTATVEMSGAGFDRGVAVTTNPRSGILYHSVLSPLTVGVPTRFLDDYVPTPPRAEVRLHRGEHLLLLWYAHRDGDAVRGFTRLAIDGDRITHVRQYLFSPEALAEVAGELGVPYRSNGHGI